jgi:hypothetical protein
MSDERSESEVRAERAAEPMRPRRRKSPLSSIVGLLAMAASVWLLHDLWPDVSYFFSSRDPIDLGAPGAYHLDTAVENRLVHVQGRLVDLAPLIPAIGAQRTAGRIAGLNLIVDKPGLPSPVALFEGRLLPAGRREGYGEYVQRLKEHGTPLGERWQVLRDGERPRHDWLPVLGAALLVLILAVNIVVLLRPLLAARWERR